MAKSPSPCWPAAARREANVVLFLEKLLITRGESYDEQQVEIQGLTFPVDS